MGDIVLLDTSVFVNLLDVPNFNQNRAEILKEFEDRINKIDYFLLPMDTIWETGDHIARLPDGSQRRKFAGILLDEVKNAFNEKAPYRMTYFPNSEGFLQWLSLFPEYAQRNKSNSKTREGISLSDLSIIKEWEETCKRHSMSRVLIWSLDSDLGGYDRVP